MKIVNVETAQPENYYGQEALLEEFKRAWARKHHNLSRVEQLHKAVMVGGRLARSLWANRECLLVA